jgi:hypothetical protein
MVTGLAAFRRPHAILNRTGLTQPSKPFNRHAGILLPEQVF